MGRKFATLESEPLEVADSEQYGGGEQRQEHEEYGSLEIFFVKQFGQGEQDKGQKTENGFLPGLGKEGKGQCQEGPMLDGVAVESPLEHQ